MQFWKGFTDGSSAFEVIHGSLTFEATDGSWSFKATDGSLGFEATDGSWAFEAIDRSSAFEATDGSLAFEATNGSLTFEVTDGSLTLKATDGSLTFEVTDGSLEFEATDGSLIFKVTDGSLAFEANDHFLNCILLKPSLLCKIAFSHKEWQFAVKTYWREKKFYKHMHELFNIGVLEAYFPIIWKYCDQLRQYFETKNRLRLQLIVRKPNLDKYLVILDVIIWLHWLIFSALLIWSQSRWALTSGDQRENLIANAILHHGVSSAFGCVKTTSQLEISFTFG